MSKPAGIDTNIILYSLFDGGPHYEAAKKFISAAARGEFHLCITPQTVSELYSACTNPKNAVGLRDLTEARRICEFVWTRKYFRRVFPRRGTIVRALELAEMNGARGKRYYDAFMASTLLDNGIARIYTANAVDFSKYCEAIDPLTG